MKEVILGKLKMSLWCQFFHKHTQRGAGVLGCCYVDCAMCEKSYYTVMFTRFEFPVEYKESFSDNDFKRAVRGGNEIH